MPTAAYEIDPEPATILLVLRLPDRHSTHTRYYTRSSSHPPTDRPTETHDAAAAAAAAPPTERPGRRRPPGTSRRVQEMKSTQTLATLALKTHTLTLGTAH